MTLLVSLSDSEKFITHKCEQSYCPVSRTPDTCTGQLSQRLWLSYLICWTVLRGYLHFSGTLELISQNLEEHFLKVFPPSFYIWRWLVLFFKKNVQVVSHTNTSCTNFEDLALTIQIEFSIILHNILTSGKEIVSRTLKSSLATTLLLPTMCRTAVHACAVVQFFSPQRHQIS
jgi:hypothetical protein